MTRRRRSQQNSFPLTRRRVLSAAAGIGAATLLGACRNTAVNEDAASSSGGTLEVDFGKAAYYPLLKSKTGVGRALDSTEILDSLTYLDEIRPALYDAEVRFPYTDWPSLKPYPFDVSSDNTVTVRRDDFFDTLYSGLQKRNIQIMDQLEGAPKQWWDYAKAKAPHKFPVPTDLEASAEAIGKWAKLYSRYPVSYCVWNEPSHNLTGSPSPASIREIIDVYDAYTSAIAPQGSFGLASFLEPNTRPAKAFGGRTYLEAAIDELRKRRKAKPDLPFDYLTLNNYGEDLLTLVDGARDALGADFNTVPIIQAQFGVFKPGTWEKSGGTTQEAARSMAALEKALGVPDLQTFTFSGWIPHLVKFKHGKALKLPLFNALKLYARMPDTRTPVQGDLPSGVGVMASGDEDRSSVLVWNENDKPYDVTLDLTRLPSRQNGSDLHVYHIDSEHGSPLEHGDADFEPTESGHADASSGKLSKKVTVAGPGLVYVEIGTASRHPVLDRGGLSATLVRKHTYADRVAGPGGRTTVRGEAYGSYDAVRAAAYLGVKGDAGTALCGAEYSGLPDTLRASVQAHLPAGHQAAEEMFGVRVDYLLAGGAAKSVLWHGDALAARRTSALPWGRGGATADVLVPASGLNRARADGATLDLPLAAQAPSGWANAGRRAIISFWMDSTGPGSRARFLLG